MRIGRREFIAIAAVVVALLFFAWFDGGEEPVRPIVQEIPYEGSAQ